MKNIIELNELVTYKLDTKMKEKGIKVFESISNTQKLQLISDHKFTKEICEIILNGLSMIQGKQIILLSGNKYMNNGPTSKVSRIGKYPIFTYDINSNLVKIEISKKHTLEDLTIGLIKVLDENMKNLNNDIKTKKLVTGGKLC